MYKTFKILLVLFLITIISISCNFYFVKAEEANENLDEPETTSNEEGNDDTVNSALDALTQVNNVTKVSNINSYEQANLQLNNILSIILIAIGVLLILFAIAILIRLKK